ncbi:efflux RND transporter periplasmic adaptor subunit [Alteromonas sp. a30]|uniref:efflux RND transporter periplasmic adaptor subunit n=1 Tax=Alteromonas sp. a30 TaxID=2730917 RepID=UPI002280A70A|nr:efflux RND transporter periplasmic adaptor subunit [Alteromonas sp. a30]MCY7294746.1 efflux RND transporter periplasmic adaptor subunit [Alteromonas sp. a30]
MSEKIQALNELRIDRDSRNSGVKEVRKSWYLLGGIVVIIALYFGYEQWTSQEVQTGVETTRIAEQLARATGKQSTTGKTSQTNLSVTPATEFANSILEVSGHITAQRIATVSAKTIGLVEEVYVEEGIYVEKGQDLARLDTRLAELNLKLAVSRQDLYQAEIDRRNAEILDAKRKLARQTELMKTNFSNQSDIDTLAINLEVLKANLATAKTNLRLNEIEVEQLEKQLDDHIIRAPFSGVVTATSAQPGEIISPSSAGGGFTRTGICTIVDMSSLEIEVDVNESFLNKIYQGQPVKAELYAYENWSFDGHVKNIVPTVDRSKATVRVRIEIENKSDRILPNMAVRVSFIDESNGTQVGMK